MDKYIQLLLIEREIAQMETTGKFGTRTLVIPDCAIGKDPESNIERCVWHHPVGKIKMGRPNFSGIINTKAFPTSLGSESKPRILPTCEQVGYDPEAFT